MPNHSMCTANDLSFYYRLEPAFRGTKIYVISTIASIPTTNAMAALTCMLIAAPDGPI
jgi:hypothetical protein